MAHQFAGVSFYELLNSKNAPKWENVTKVVHRCASTFDTVFNEEVNDENRYNSEFWEGTCNHQEGLVSIFVYTGEKVTRPPNEKVIKSRSMKEKRMNAPLLATFGCKNRRMQCLSKVIYR